MNRKELYNGFNEIDDDILERSETATTSRKRLAWIKWGAIAACLAFALWCGTLMLGDTAPSDNPGLQLNSQPTENTEQRIDGTETKDSQYDNRLEVNQLSQFVSADMDIELSFYENSDAISSAFHDTTGMQYGEFISHIPADFEVSSHYTVDVPTEPSSGQYTPHDCVIEAVADNGGEVRIAMSGFGEPCRDLLIMSDNPIESQVNGISLIIYGYQDVFLVKLCHNNVYYDIETTGISLQALEGLLSGLLPVS